MKRYTLFVLLSGFCALTASSQGYLRDVDGRPMTKTDYTSVQGFPYLFADWTRGAIKLHDGTIYTDVELRYDIVRDKVLFKSENGEPLEFASAVKEFSLLSEKSGQSKLRIFKSGFGTYKRFDSKAYYEVLDDGKRKLLKKTEKVISETPVYNGPASKAFQENVTFLISNGSELVLVKKDRKQVLEALSDKATDLERYIAANKLDLKDEANLTKLVNYYNSL